MDRRNHQPPERLIPKAVTAVRQAQRTASEHLARSLGLRGPAVRSHLLGNDTDGMGCHERRSASGERRHQVAGSSNLLEHSPARRRADLAQA